ncbi:MULTISPECIES: alpha/beta hydrolase family protein [unclassified Gordonia (in: high G+C Gram-positive bacteria)]|uniref:alpha/beta hydrolase n=1 Tax=unclassified Gordonia (in: high G+C Gram-positive bacteria) TaxID=2657482 RepID=UPI001F0FD666|nr:alpha/beta hydrolase family protein [Gordonia sp. ABSL49_1]MCH5645498.1 esterase family protein [Gordonia sp. ABSL49_1]
MRRRRRIIVSLIVVLAVIGIGAPQVGNADAASFGRFYVSGCGMPSSPVDMWTKWGNYKTVIALDGLRATKDMSGWRHETKIQRLADSGVNVIEPVGGLASFYTDWQTASPGNKIKYRYRWTCRLNTIIRELDARGLAVGPLGKYAIMGISMGGNAAAIYGAYHRKRISHIFSMSGYLNLSAPTMREAVRLALIDAGMESGMGPFSADAMWGPPWNKRWTNNDALVQLPRMRGMKIRVASGSATWGSHNTDAVASVKGTPLEMISLAQTRAFEVAANLQGIRISTDFPNVGTHQWDYWQDMVWRAKNQKWFRDR